MTQSQINILNLGQQLNYYVEYINDSQYVKSVYKYCCEDYDGDNHYDIGDGIVFVREGSQNIYRDVNNWYSTEDLIETTDYMGEYVNESSINLYFPQHSVETYESGVKYALNISTFINGIKVQLSSTIIDRANALPPTNPVKYKGKNYYECINVKFPDPWVLCYSDEWMNFRHNICHEFLQVNNTGSIILIELTPVEKSEDGWVCIPDYSSGSTSLTMKYDVSDYMYLQMLPIVNAEHPHVSVDIKFNAEYNGDLITYLFETYSINLNSIPTWRIRYDLAYIGADDIYKYWTYITDVGNPETSHIFTKADLDFKSWDEFLLGLSFKATATIIDEYENEIFGLVSDSAPITPEIFRHYINTPIDSINLDLVHMYNYHVDVVNKIQKNIIKVDKPEDYKANILKPVFVTSHPVHNVNFHPQVTESVCIDLNPYKNKVEMFYIRIEGVNFVETGRTAGGVIFKIQGTSLPNETPSGIYYILDQNKELVTTGNYTYIQ